MSNTWSLLAKEAAALTQHEEAKKSANTVKKTAIAYEITDASYPDIAVKRTSSRVTKQLIILFTQGTAFIKTKQKGKDPVSEVLTEKSYADFMQASPEDIPLPDHFWAPTLRRGVEFGRRLNGTLRSKDMITLIINKLIDDIEDYHYNARVLKAFSEVPEIVKEYHSRNKIDDLVLDYPIFVKDLLDRFGIDNTREFLNEYERSLITITNFNYRPTDHCDDFEKTCAASS